MVKATSVTSKARMASYKVAHRIAQSKKTHTIAEELHLPAAIDMVSIMLDETSADKLKAIPLSNDTIARRIYMPYLMILKSNCLTNSNPHVLPCKWTRQLTVTKTVCSLHTSALSIL